MTNAFDNIHSRLEGMAEPAYIDNEKSTADSVSRIVIWLGGTVIGLLLTRLVLTFFSTAQNHIWITFIYKISYFFAVPFFWIFNYHAADKSYGFEPEILMAIVCYAAVVWLIVRILELWP